MNREKSFNNNQNDVCTLNDWITLHNSVDEKREIFLNMDRSLKYIHEHDFCVRTFFKNDFNDMLIYNITVLNNDPSYVKFESIMPLPKDIVKKEQMKREDILVSGLIQVCSYVGIPLNRLNLQFLKDNFDSFSQFLPSDDVPYYRGIIVRGSSVYYCEYMKEKSNHNLEKLDSGLQENDGSGKGKSLIKMSNNRIDLENVNDLKNSQIYRKDIGISDGAFINYLLLPTILIFCILAISMFIWIVSLF